MSVAGGKAGEEGGQPLALRRVMAGLVNRLGDKNAESIAKEVFCIAEKTDAGSGGSDGYYSHEPEAPFSKAC